jgi:hypothetical protein
MKTYTNAIAKLISEGLFLFYKEVFLNYNRIKDYYEATEKFISIPEIKELNQNWKGVYSAALNHYVQFLIDWQENNMFENPKHISPEIIDSEARSKPEAGSAQHLHVEDEHEEDIDWEERFTDEEGKLTRLANPALIDLLRPCLDTEYRSTASAFNIVEDFYAGQYSSMQMKDWQKLFENINWTNPYYSPTSSEPEGKKKKHILRVTFPNGSIIQERIVAKTLVEVVSYSGPERVALLNIYLAGVNLVSKELSNKYPQYQVLIQDGYYVMTLSDTPRKYQIIKTISDALNLGLAIDFISIEDSSQFHAKPVPYLISVQSRAKIRVTFPNGRVVQKGRVSHTLLEVIKFAGPENVRDLQISIKNDNLITNKVNPSYKNSLKSIGDGLFVHMNSSTQTKFAQIQQISDELSLGLIIELV